MKCQGKERKTKIVVSARGGVTDMADSNMKELLVLNFTSKSVEIDKQES